MRTSAITRASAASGAAYVVLICVGNAMATAGGSGAAHPSGRRVLADEAYQAARSAASVGFVLEVLGFVVLMVFLGYLSVTFRRGLRAGSPAQVSAGTALVAALTMLAIKLGSAAPMIVLRLDRQHLEPGTAQVLNDLGGAAFVLSWLPFGVFVAALAIALRGTGALGRPSAVAGVVLGLVGVPLSIAGMRDPVSASPVAFLLGLLWLAGVSVRLAVRSSALEEAPVDARERRHPAAVPAVG